ncbi:MAG: twin-arginine translocase subunit TatC [Candidatus Omnitrophica bacterium]|nr:twin-arginine translocase subunit TatC [Candidatus Omnitrophota bacterium]
MDKEMNFWEHIEELRRRIIVCLITLTVGMMVGFPFSRYVLRILKLPGCSVIDKLVFFSPQEGFLIYLRISFLIGLVLAFPVILYQVWAFIAPAIEKKFRRYILNFVFSGTIFFVIGMCFIYFILLPPAFKFLLSFASTEMEPVISATRYISFVIALLVAGGLVFQMPVLSFLFTRIGLINWRFLKDKFKYAVVIIFILAALITPTVDIFNLLLLAIPMIFLYGASIFVSFLVRPKIRYEHTKALQNI